MSKYIAQTNEDLDKASCRVKLINSVINSLTEAKEILRTIVANRTSEQLLLNLNFE